jgi:TetR/AcrR family fatty acid metabolism transcriptional regulator
VRVLVREVTRSPQLQNEIGEIVLAFQALERIIERGKAEGSFRADLDSRLAATMVYGALEEILTGWVMGQLPDSDEDVAAAERAVAATFAHGLAGTSRAP